MQPNLPDGAQEKMQELEELQERGEDVVRRRAQLEQQLEQSEDGRELLRESGEEAETVLLTMDDVSVEVDYETALDHFEDKIQSLQDQVSGLERREQKVEQQMEDLQEELQDMMEEFQSGPAGGQ